MSEIYVKCSCHGEGLYINYEKEDKLYYFSFFSIGYRCGKLSFLNKLRWIWQILFRSKPFDDQLVFNKEEARSISDFIRTNSVEI